MTDSQTLIPRANEQLPEPKPRRLEISATQLIGGALAAMTAATIGARLGVAGTVVGAAVGSVVAGSAGTLYTASLKHTREKITAAFVGRVGQTDVELTTVSTDTSGVDSWTWDQPAAATAPPSLDPVSTSDVDRAGHSASRWPWKPILASTAAVFLLAIAGITGFELITGQSVSGGQGTTITQVGEGGSGTPTQVPSSDTSTEPTADPSAAPSSGTSTAPSNPSQNTEPTTEPSQNTEPTTEPSQNRGPTSNSEPTSSTAPSTADGNEDSQDSSDTGGAAGG